MKPQQKFYKGDRVKVVREVSDSGTVMNKVGTVLETRDGDGYSIPVEYDDNWGGHHCNGLGRDGHCFYTHKSALELISRPNPIMLLINKSITEEEYREMIKN